jgi:hypothetical protein
MTANRPSLVQKAQWLEAIVDLTSRLVMPSALAIGVAITTMSMGRSNG